MADFEIYPNAREIVANLIIENMKSEPLKMSCPMCGEPIEVNSIEYVCPYCKGAINVEFDFDASSSD